MKAIERLYQYLYAKSIQPNSLESICGLSDGYLSAQLKRKATLGESVISKILNACNDLSGNWLLTGNGEMILQPDMSTKAILKELISVKETVKELTAEKKQNQFFIDLQIDKIKQLEFENFVLKNGTKK